jgi:hypothetical protein
MMRSLLTFLLLAIGAVVAAQPTIGNFIPKSAAPGMGITITGSGFTSATSVSIGGVTAAFTINSATQITATVPVTASGSVMVTNPSGTATMNGFIYVPTSEIMTDFGGFWHARASSPQTNNPDNSHHLLGFTHNGVTYATGVDNSKLTNNHISFIPSTFKALPVAAIAGVASGSGATYISLAAKVDGSATSAYVAGVSSYTIRQALIDGLNGLDMGTGVTNLPSSATMTFQIYNIDAAKASDAEPDLILTQIASPTSSNDVFTFVDASGNMVGNSFTQDMTHLPRFGTYILDLFTMAAGVPYNAARPYAVASGGTNTTRDIRLVSLNLSSFGINAGNATSVKALQITPSGNSDYAFIGYNTESINLPPNAAMSIETSVTRICTGGTASLEVIGTPAAGGVLTYTWEESVDNGATWSVVTEGGNYSGAITDRLRVANATVGYRYRASVHEAGNGNAGISGVFTITAAAGTRASAVSISGGGTVCVNTSAQFTSLVTGGSNLIYQWQSNASGSFRDVPGANTSVEIPNTATTGTVGYRLLVSPGAGCPGDTSNTINLTVNGISSTTGFERCGNGSVTLSGTATSGTVSWFTVESGGIAAATTDNFTIASLAATTTYYAAATGCTQRVPVIATVNPASAAGSVTSMAGNDPGTTVLTLSSHTGTVIKWQSSTDNFNTMIADMAYTQAQIVVNNSSQPTQYRAVVQSGNCAPVNSASSAAIITLPIRANSLKLSERGSTVQLQWETIDQQGAVAYEIERSADGIYFTTIGTVALQTSQQYQWLDTNPGTGTVAYRIKEVRLSGNVYYSNTASIRLQYTSGLRIYPNPAKGNQVNVQLQNRVAGKYQLVLYTATGQTIYTSTVNHSGVSTVHTIRLQDNFSAGIYHLQLLSPDGKKEHSTILLR